MPQLKYDDAILEYVNRFWRERHYSPSIRDICEACAIPSTGHCSAVLDTLASRGLLSRDPKVARSIVPAWVHRRMAGHVA